MKRSYSCSSLALPVKQQKSYHHNTSLTFDALEEHNKETPRLSPFTRFEMAPEGSSTLSDIPIFPPPSTHSSRTRSSSPSRISNTHYQGGHLRRANIFVDVEAPTDISTYLYKKVLYNLINNDSKLCTISEKLWSKSKELTEALHMAIDELSQLHETIQLSSTQPSEISESPFPLPTIPVFKLKDPRPDIYVGLLDESIIIALEPRKGLNAARSFLLDLQDTSSLISDPHVTPLGLRFPFLIVEAKAAATGGNLYQAQNQAAVSSSTALQILKNMSDLNQESQEEIEKGNQPEQGFNQKLAFSVTTEGPIHELWLHFRTSNEDFYMACVGAWRITLKDGSMDLLRHLFAVLRWGDAEFRNTIVSTLQLV
ncbi:hypothetical protein BDV06DRAFT_234484 [Aspergillus oleicola]